MKILAIIGSSQQGNTAEMVRYFERQLKGIAELEVELLYLHDYPIEFCNGCHICMFQGEEGCPHRMNVRQIEAKMEVADGIVMASPVYMFTVSSVLKNLLEHLAYNCQRPKYFGKKIYFLASCNKMVEKNVFWPMVSWAKAAGFTIVGKTYFDMLPIPLKNDVIDKKRAQLKKGAQKFYKALQSEGTSYDLGRIIVFRVMRVLCWLAPQVFKANYDFYNANNAYHKKVKWLQPGRLPAFKGIVANLVEAMYKRDIAKIVELERLGESKRYINRL